MIYKSIYLLAVMVSFSVCTPAKIDPDRKRLMLLGTVHAATGKVNADSVYNVLVDFKPDLVLIELDSSFFYEDFTFKTLFDGNEMVALTRYKMNNPGVEIRPIEFEGRETYREKIGVYPEITQEFGEALKKLSVTNQLNAEDKKSLDKLLYFDSLNSVLKSSDLRTINNSNTDRIIDSLNYYKYQKLMEISNKYPVFSSTIMTDSKNEKVTLRENFRLYADFEAVKRNDALATNAIRIIKANPDKKIIILVGFAHRPYMLKQFKKNNIQVSGDVE